jgi:hypothetical protein
MPVQSGATATAPPHVWGWDTSHYDGVLSVAVMRQAKAEGIEFVTGKIGEGGSYDDPLDTINLTAARDAGMPLVGGYYVPRSSPSIAAQVANCIALADKSEPWWRTFAGWFWQVDLERWPTDSVPASVGIEFGLALGKATGKPVVMYASRGQYGNGLAGWPGHLWNAHYPSSREAPFKALYPGDDFIGWTAYSGKVPLILQYASTATIAGRTTCDANAFRGTLAELTKAIMGGTDMTTLDAGDAKVVWYTKNLPSANPTMTPATALLDTQIDVRSLLASQAAQDKQLSLVLAAVNALSGAGSNIDTAVIIKAVNDASTAESALVTQLAAELADTRARLAAAEQAAHDILTAP